MFKRNHGSRAPAADTDPVLMYSLPAGGRWPPLASAHQRVSRVPDGGSLRAPDQNEKRPACPGAREDNGAEEIRTPNPGVLSARGLPVTVTAASSFCECPSLDLNQDQLDPRSSASAVGLDGRGVYRRRDSNSYWPRSERGASAVGLRRLKAEGARFERARPAESRPPISNRETYLTRPPLRRGVN